MTEEQILFLLDHKARGHTVFWRGNDGFFRLGDIKKHDNEMKALLIGKYPGAYVDLYGVDVDDLLITIEMKVEWP